MKCILAIFFLISGLASYSQSFSEIVKVVASDRGENDRMGYAVTIDGNYAAVGAYALDEGALDPNVGAVYIYEMQGLNNWVQIQKISNSDQDDYDRFGWSVDMDGDFLVVGAYGEDEDVNDANNMSKAGSAYIFQNIAGTWTETQKIVASDRDAGDEFGWSVSIYDSTLVVGAHIEDHDAFGADFKYHSGSVYLFELNGAGNWIETQKVVADDRWVDINFPNGYSGEDLADQFGGSVGLWGDYLIVGAHSHDYATTSPLSGGLWTSGAAYIFERTAGIWNQVQKIQNSDRESWDRFGYAVAIDSNVIAVCAYSEDEDENGNNALTNPGSVYLFERNGAGNWNEVQKIVPNDRSSGDHFGFSIDIDDTLMILGCHSDDHDEFAGDLKTDAGSAYVFEKNAGIWSQYQKIDASDRATLDDFGISVGIDGHTILVGSDSSDFDAAGINYLDDAGAAYFFSNNLCPILVTNTSPTICDGFSYTVGTSTYTVAGNYVDVLTTATGCDSTINTNLTVTNGVSSDVYASMCDGGVYYIFGTPTTVAGNYSYVLTAQNGCDSTVITHLTMDPPITSDNYVSICYGESYTIGSSTYTTAGTYQDVVSATNFCDSTIFTHLSVQLPNDASISQNQSVLTANETGATYQWFDCENGNAIVGGNNQTFYATYVGDFGVVVTKNGCSDTSECVHVDNIVVGIGEKFANQFIIFPNPSRGSFTINLPISETGTIRIFNSAGQTVAEALTTSEKIEFANIPQGIYIVEYSTSNYVVRKKLVVH